MKKYRIPRKRKKAIKKEFGNAGYRFVLAFETGIHCIGIYNSELIKFLDKNIKPKVI